MAETLNILFTCAGRRVVLIEQFRRALQELGVGGRVFATDISPTAAALQAADEGLVVPRCSDPAYLPRLLELVATHDIALLVPLTDVDLQQLADARQDLADRGCTVMIGDSEGIRTCRDKHCFARAVEAAGLPVGRSVDLQTFRRAPFYPCFAKPLDGSGSIGAGVIVDENSLTRHVAKFGEQLVIQDVLDGGEYTIDVYRTRDGEFKAIVPRQRLVVRGGEVEQGLTVNDPALIEATRQLVSHFDGLWGAMCCQCRRGAEGPIYFFELNPRFGGGVPLSIRAGADLPMYLLQEVLGREVDGAVGQFTDRLLMMRYPAGAVFHVEDPSKLRGFETPMFR